MQSESLPNQNTAWVVTHLLLGERAIESVGLVGGVTVYSKMLAKS